jgi:hypothetical protein
VVKGSAMSKQVVQTDLEREVRNLGFLRVFEGVGRFPLLRQLALMRTALFLSTLREWCGFSAFSYAKRIGDSATQSLSVHILE